MPTFDTFGNFLAAFTNIVMHLQVKDFFDILVVAALFYLILLLLKRTHSFFMLDGIILLFLIYVGARFFQLYLTQLLFQYFFTFFVVVIVVVFQKEIRSFFEWISVRGRLKRRAKSGIGEEETLIETIIKSVKYLAEKKIGALIVLPGEQPLVRFLEGGFDLNGRVSMPLLLSIFDPTSPGHDGAVLIEEDVVKKFAVHLPLADHLEGLRNVGTRHRAAVGLSERSDALTIVVSEERGTVSLAQFGTLSTMKDFEELEGRLRAFFRTGAHFVERKPWVHWITNNWPQKLSAIVLAVFLWFTLVFQLGFLQRQMSVPIEFRFLPNGLVVDQVVPQEVDVTLSGRSGDFSLLKPDSLHVVVDASDFEVGWQRVVMSQSLIQVPQALTIVNFTPKAIQFHITNKPASP